MWTFASGVDPASFNFDPLNTYFYFLAYDTADADSLVDRIDYYDNRGHKVLSGVVQHNSRGSRIAVDKSYVTGYSSWNYYYTFWSTSTPFSPVVIVVDTGSHELFKQISVQHITTDHYLYLRNARAWIWEDANGNGAYDSNASDTGDRIIQWYQQKGGTCGIFTTINIAASVWGNGSSSTYPITSVDDVISWYSTYIGYTPPYDPATMDLNDGTWSSYGGTNVLHRNAYLTSQQGFRNSSYTFDFSTLVSLVESGKLVHVSLDAYKIWAYYFPAGADADYDGYVDAGYTGSPSQTGGWHAVWVRGFQRDAQGNITHVIIADSGIGPQGAFAKVDISHFLNACASGNIGYVDPPAGKTWSTAGINTWTFNPAVYSALW
jgi:hypothetical protein